MKSNAHLLISGVLCMLLFVACGKATEADTEQQALKFLYTYMPLADSIDYSADFYLMNIRAARRAEREMPWGKDVPEKLFRYFVLPVRVNNEALDSARVVFYEELKPRVENLSMQDAILEVNHWCHEKVVYQPTDSRTSSPLATVRTAYGRCGEESTFLVAALRSVGIPARQVYTPRWAHTDDNHAWVEAWADGKWFFLGACEPEPILNLGWFNAPASRGMLMNAKVFGHYDGPEEILAVTPNGTEINVTEHYAPVVRSTVVVKDLQGNVVPDARVEFKLYNYAEFYSIVAKQTDDKGSCSLTTGKGDLLVWASKGDRFGFAKLSAGTQAELTVTLNKQEGDIFEEELEIVPPAESATLPTVTPEQRAENDRRMAQEDAIRHAYEATMMNEESATDFVHSLAGGFTPEETAQAVKFLVASRGNHAVLTKFLQTAVAVGKQQRALLLLSLVSAKDLRDVRYEVLNDHLQNSLPVAKGYEYVLNPRISVEELTAYKFFFQSQYDHAAVNAFRNNPSVLIERCKETVTIDNNRNALRIPISPVGMWKSRLGDSRSRDIAFVAIARSFGIPAWIDRVTGKVRYINLSDNEGEKEAVYDVDFGEETVATQAVTGRLKATYKPNKIVDNPKYESHFTL